MILITPSHISKMPYIILFDEEQEHLQVVVANLITPKDASLELSEQTAQILRKRKEFKIRSVQIKD